MVDEASTIITRSVIDLAQELKIKVVAEGVEKMDQLDYLKGLNCYSGQGHLFNKPVPAEEFEELLSKEKCSPTQLAKENKEGREKRRYFRIKIPQSLEADMSVVETPGQKFKIAI
jgi:predicted signal transduction protein with EAL and GGDEF domain